MSQAPLFADTVIDQYRPLIKSRARSFHRGWLARNMQLDELEAVATIAVWQAVETYRDDRGAKFGTYVIHVVNNALIREQKHWNKKKRKALLVSTAPGLDGELPVILVDSGPGPAASADGTQMRHAVRAAVDALEPRLKEIVERRYWRDETLHEIGESWGLSRERIRQLEAKAFEALKPRLRFLWLGTKEAA